MFSQKIFYKRLSLIIAILLMLTTLSSCGDSGIIGKLTNYAWLFIGVIFGVILISVATILFFNKGIVEAIFLLCLATLAFLVAFKGCEDIKKEKTELSEKTDHYKKRENSPNQSESERKLRDKISEIQRIREELTQKQGEAVKAKEKYRQDVDLYKSEINQSREKLNISSYQGASGNHRIKGNIMLIQQRLAYIQSIEEIQSGIEVGIESLTTTERKIEGDLTYVKLLDKEKANQLLLEVTRAIDANKQYMGEFVIKVDENKLKSPEKIWDEIVSGNL